MLRATTGPHSLDLLQRLLARVEDGVEVAEAFGEEAGGLGAGVADAEGEDEVGEGALLAETDALDEVGGILRPEPAVLNAELRELG